MGRALTLIPTLTLALTLTLILRTQEASSYYLLSHLLTHNKPLTTTTYYLGSVEIELHMKSFSPRGETRSPEVSEVKAEAEGRAAGGGGGGGGGTASSIDSPYDSPYRTPVEPRRVLVLPYFVDKPKNGRPARPKRLIGRGWPDLGAAPGNLWRC